MKKKNELQEKISKAHRFRKIAIICLIASVAFTFLGMLFSAMLFIMSYVAFIICTGIISFLTVLKWLHSKTLKREMEEKSKPPLIKVCSRCGAKVRKNLKYCPKCGKMIRTKKH